MVKERKRKINKEHKMIRAKNINYQITILNIDYLLDIYSKEIYMLIKPKSKENQ
jgi:hypothetical protein